MQMPNFLIIGAAKAGTTSLYAYLAQHPQVYMSRQKEPRFFAIEGVTPNYGGITQGINRGSISCLEDYQRLFEDVGDEVAIGEASTLYLYSPKAPERIAHHIPQTKLIAVLRNPVDRAFSSYVHLVRDGFETLSFAEGLAAEASRRAENWQPLWFYQDRGFYYEQLKRYFDRFEAAQIQIYLYEDLLENSQKTAQDIYRFLNVEASFVPDLTRSNVSGIPKRRWLQNLFMKDNPLKSAIKPLLPEQLRKQVARNVHRQNTGAKPKLSLEVRQRLVETYREDILKLQDLIDRDLSGWLK